MLSSPCRLHHLALGSVDPESLAGFYHQAFGLQIERTHRDSNGRVRSIWLSLGTGRLMIERVDEQEVRLRPRPRTPERPSQGLFLLAFEVTQTEHPAYDARLEDLGCVEDGRTAYTSYWRDPEGHRIALSHFE